MFRNMNVILFVSLLLLMCGDVESNPGPRNPTENCINIYHLNVRSLVPSIDVLTVEAANFDIIGVTETWLDDSIKSEDIAIEGHALIRKDRNRHGGGVAIYISNELGFRQLEPAHVPIEYLCIEVYLRHSSVIVCCLYKPPSISVND